MFKSLFGKNKENDAISIKLKEIESDFTNKNYERVISEGEEILDQVDKKKKPDLLRILALVYFRNENYEKSTNYFKALCSEKSDNPDNWFNLATSLILNKEAEKGLDALEDAISVHQQKGKRENMPVSYMIFYVMNALTDTEEYNLAFEQLDRLSIVYKGLSVTDNQFLHSRGYVPFSGLIERAKVILENQNQVNAIDWLEDFSSYLDENGQIQIDSMIEDLKMEQQQDKQV